MIHTNRDMTSCIDACQACHETCLMTMNHCYKMGGRHVSPAHLELMSDCIDICGLSVDFMIRASDFAPQLCALCADVCERCADDCEHFGDEMMRKCAITCRNCAEACQALSKTPTAHLSAPFQQPQIGLG